MRIKLTSWIILLLFLLDLNFGLSVPLNNHYLDDSLSGKIGIRGPRPDEVDLTGVHVWYNNSSVPSHDDLGFRVMPDASLTIYPGVTVKFDSGTQLLVEGTLKIIGTAKRPVNLTSSSSSPTPTDWGGVRFEAASSGFINNSNITYCSNGITFYNVNNLRLVNNTVHEVQIGIKLDTGSDYNDIINNSIYNCNTAIALYNSDHNMVINNTINSSSVSDISISVSANNNLISNNNLTSKGSRGISITGDANNNTFISNEIISHGEDGIRCSKGQDNIFKFNIINLNKRNGAVFYTGSDRNILIDNRLNNNTRGGLAFEGGNSCNAINNELTGNGYGIYSAKSKAIIIENNTISASINYDMELIENSNVTSIDNAFDPSNVIVYDLSTLSVYWYMFLETRNVTNQLTSAIVNISDNFSQVLVPDIMISGKLDWIKCLGYVQRSYGKNSSMNPYWVTADNGSKKIKLSFDMSEGSKTCVVDFIYYPSPATTLPELIEFPEEKELELNLSKYFSSSESLEFDIDILTGDKISYSYDDQSTKLYAIPPLNWNGEEYLKITAAANLGGEVSRNVKLRVTALNDPPLINKTIPNQMRYEGEPSWELNLSTYATDPDIIYGDKLNWFVTGVNDTLLNVIVASSGETIIFTPKSANITGNNELKLWVEDMVGENDFRTIWVNITAINDEPFLSNMNVFPNNGQPSTYFNYTVKYFDIDNDLPAYVLVRIDNKSSFEMSEVAIADVNVMDGKSYYYSTTLNSSTHFYWFECHDGFGGYASSPRLNGPTVSMPDKGSIKGMVIDKNTSQAIFQAEITITNLANLSQINKTTTDLDGNYTMINLIPGKYQIYAKAAGYKDSRFYNRTLTKGGISILNIYLEKLPADVKDTPITNVWVEANRTNISLNAAVEFTAHATDLDGDVLNFYWVFNDGTDPSWGKIVSHNFYITGTFNITLTVFDTDGNFEKGYINITVHLSNKSDHSEDGDGAKTTSDSEDIMSNDIILLISIIIVVIIIIITVIMVLYKNQQARLEAEAEEESNIIAEKEKEHKRRKRKYDFVDKEKRNVEQINILITELHKSRMDKARRRKGKGQKKARMNRKSKAKKHKKT